MLPTKFRFIWPSGFRGEDLKKSADQKQELPMAVMFVNGSELNQQSLERIFQECFLPSFDSFGKAVLEDTIFQKSTIQKQELPVVAMFVNGSELNEHSLQRPSKDASYQVLIHLANRFQRRFFRNQPIRNKNCLWWPCLLTDQDEMSNLYREPAIDAAYQALVHLAKRFQRRFKKNQPIRNKNCLWWPCLVMDHNKMCTL